MGRLEGEGEESCPVPEAVGFLETKRQKSGRVCIQTRSGGCQATVGVFAWGHQIKPQCWSFGRGPAGRVWAVGIGVENSRAIVSGLARGLRR